MHGGAGSDVAVHACMHTRLESLTPQLRKSPYSMHAPRGRSPLKKPTVPSLASCVIRTTMRGPGSDPMRRIRLDDRSCARPPCCNQSQARRPANGIARPAHPRRVTEQLAARPAPRRPTLHASLHALPRDGLAVQPAAYASSLSHPTDECACEKKGILHQLLQSFGAATE